MIKHIPYETLYHTHQGWLNSRFHFSFAEYHNPDNKQFGVLRVMNDDKIAPHSGFDMHPHRDMEIITYMIDGELTHEDSMGHRGSIRRGEVQYMSAGTGVAHSEKNESDKEAHLIQLWIFPDAHGLTPVYGSRTFHFDDRHNRWLHIAGPHGSTAPITMHQDANLFVIELDKERSERFELQDDRQLYLKVMEGEVQLNSQRLGEGDAAEITQESIEITSLEDAHLLLVEMKHT